MENSQVNGLIQGRNNRITPFLVKLNNLLPDFGEILKTRFSQPPGSTPPRDSLEPVMPKRSYTF
jgi:hypothetical protein